MKEEMWWCYEFELFFKTNKNNKDVEQITMTTKHFKRQ